MASSSSSNTAPSNNKLQNSYFFYGTHPLKVPHILTHANSTTSLSTSSTDQNSLHLSLNLTNNNHNNFRHGFLSTTDITTTKSLSNLTQSCPDDGENNEVKRNVSQTIFYHINMSLSK